MFSRREEEKRGEEAEGGSGRRLFRCRYGFCANGGVWRCIWLNSLVSFFGKGFLIGLFWEMLFRGLGCWKDGYRRAEKQLGVNDQGAWQKQVSRTFAE